ncbi:MAG: hypothetical protein KatS3mg102_1656 [Planctomycetota bacterium]|nr:MAG: hypothetical protein KatS3mg102_1656 [Planctomycetota bacterium]
MPDSSALSPSEAQAPRPEAGEPAPGDVPASRERVLALGVAAEELEPCRAALAARGLELGLGPLEPAAVRARPPALLLLPISPHEPDAVAVLRAAREADVPVLALTEPAERVAAETARRLGALAVLARPLEPGRLAEVCEAVLRARADERRHAEALRAELAGACARAEAYRHQAARNERLATLGYLVAAVSHEVGNCLTGITGYCQLLLSDPEAEGLPRPELERIEAEGRRAVRIIQSMLSLAREPSSRREMIDLAAVVAQSVELLHYHLSRQRIQLETEIPERLPFGCADPSQVQQILLNLLKNACQALAAHRGAGCIRVRARACERKLEVEVADDGPGIPEPVRAHIFQPFFTTKGEGEGTGLGLALSRDLARGFGGELRLASSPLGGACFVLEIPQWQPEQEASGSGARAAGAAAAGGRAEPLADETAGAYNRT